ncbi:MAG: hypothetical protein ACP5VP_08930 [Candidatus Limnocylindrales bacterium]
MDPRLSSAASEPGASAVRDAVEPHARAEGLTLRGPRSFLTVRDLPLWLALVGLAVMALSGVAEASADPGLAPTVALVLGGCLLALVVGRVLVRRIAYRRAWRVSLAILVVLVLFPLLGALAFLLLPAAIALLAIELLAPAPIPDGRPSAVEAVEAGEATRPPDFDWPDDTRS